MVATWASWNILALRVHSHHVAWSFAHSASRDVRQDLVTHQGHGGDWHVGGEPVGFTVSVGILAHSRVLAESVWHRAEPSDTRTGRAETLGLMLKVTNGVEERVTVPQFSGASWTGWYTSGLRVSSE